MGIKKIFYQRKAFTLIELLGVIFIITLIATTVFLSISNSRQKGREIKKINNINQIQIALENYKRVEGTYPDSIVSGQSLIGSSTGVTFMSQVPSNLNDTDMTCGDSSYNYSSSDDGDSYFMYFCLAEKVENYTAGLKKVTPAGISSPTSPVFDSSNWAVGSGTLSKTTYGGSFSFTQNGLTSENERVLGTNPFGQESVVWETRPVGDNNADGGWNSVYTDMPIDSTKMYRFSVWFKKTSVDSSGRVYLGLRGYSGSTNTGVFILTTGASNTNPYFFYRNISDFDKDKWYLIVGHTHPHNTAATVASVDSGVYDVDGNKVFAANDFKWKADNNYTIHRTYHYYSTISTPRLQFFDPRIYIVDGSEPSVEEMLQNLVLDVH